MKKIECTLDEFFKMKDLKIEDKLLKHLGYVGSKVCYDNPQEKEELIPVFIKKEPLK